MCECVKGVGGVDTKAVIKCILHLCTSCLSIMGNGQIFLMFY